MTASAQLLPVPAGWCSTYDVEAAGDFDSLLKLCPALQHEPAGNDFFSSWIWFENLSRHGIEARLQKVLLVVRERASGVAFCLPLLKHFRGAGAMFGPVVGGLSTYYSSLYGVIGDPLLVTTAGLRAAFAYVRREYRCGVIDLRPLDASDPFYAMTVKALNAEGFSTDSYFCFGNWHLDIAGRSFAAYERSIPSRLRNSVKRGRKKLDGSGAWKIEVQSAPGATLETAIADFQTIYAKSWKVPEPFPRFVPELCRTAAASGWLRLGVLRFENQPIAAQLWIVKNRRALIYKLAYVEDFKRFSAGSVLSFELMRRAIDDDKVVDVDYLTGDDRYKADWMSHRRERVGLVAFHRHSLRGRLSELLHYGGRWWRRRELAREGAALHPSAPGGEAGGHIVPVACTRQRPRGSWSILARYSVPSEMPAVDEGIAKSRSR